MSIRRLTAFTLSAVFVLAACTTGGGTSAAPSAASAPARQHPRRPAKRQQAPPHARSGFRGTTSSSRAGRPTTSPSIKDTVEAGGGTYISADANLSTEQQLTDVTTMLSQGANVLIILAQDTTVIGPAVQAAKDAGVPVIAYDRLIEDPRSCTSRSTTSASAGSRPRRSSTEVPSGNYVLIKGDPGDPNASTFLPSGWGPSMTMQNPK